MKLNKLMILLLCLVLCVSCAKKDEVEIAEYDAKMVCTYEFNEVIDDEKVKSTSNIYLDYNKIRTPNTYLTNKELDYCCNDCLVMFYGLRKYLEKYNNAYRKALQNQNG